MVDLVRLCIDFARPFGVRTEVATPQEIDVGGHKGSSIWPARQIPYGLDQQAREVISVQAARSVTSGVSPKHRLTDFALEHEPERLT